MMARRQRPQKVAVSLPAMESAPEHWLRHIRISGFAVTILSLIVLSIVVLAPSLRTLVAQQHEIALLNKTVAEKRQAVEDLENDVARWDDPAYIEAQARGRLHYVFPGDISYDVIDDGKTPTTEDGAPISDTIQTTKVDWLQTLVSSVMTAGLTDATVDDLNSKSE